MFRALSLLSHIFCLNVWNELYLTLTDSISQTVVVPCPLPWEYNQDGCNGGNLKREYGEGGPGAQLSGPGKFIGCQLNTAEVPRRWSSSEERPGDMEAGAEGTLPGALVLRDS